MRNVTLMVVGTILLVLLGNAIYFRYLRVMSDEPANQQYQFVKIADGFERPLYVTHAGDERLFVVEQRGVVWIIQDGEVLPDPFLDIQEIVNDNENEQGLLSIAFDPNYAENGFFYVNYTGEDGEIGDTHIERYRVSADDPNLADPDSAEPILHIAQPYGNHNGGQLQFGPDGYLYIGMGDGGSGGDPHGNGQSLTTLLGKLLRIDVHGDEPYAIPSDNPFVGSDDALPEIWAYGLRNPWRFSFDRATGDLYIGDVGQDQTEEIDFQPADSSGGENYGWNFYEGERRFRGVAEDESIFTPPMSSYDHDDVASFADQGITLMSHCSVTGGYVYRGAALPDLQGTYLFGDYCSGAIWLLKREGEEWVTEPFIASGFTLSSFGEDVEGELYVTNFGDGGVWKLVARE